MISELKTLVHELREAARNMQGNLDRGLYRHKDVGEMQKASYLLFAAANTIEGLRKQVAKCQIAELKADYDTSRHFELFGTPERAARTLAKACDECDGRNQGKRAFPCWECPLDQIIDSNMFEPEILEWLRGDVE